MNPVVQIQVKHVVLVTSVERVKYLIELRLLTPEPPHPRPVAVKQEVIREQRRLLHYEVRHILT